MYICTGIRAWEVHLVQIKGLRIGGGESDMRRHIHIHIQTDRHAYTHTQRHTRTRKLLCLCLASLPENGFFSLYKTVHFSE